MSNGGIQLDDDLDFSLTPETEVAQSHEMPPLERPWLRTSGRIKIVQLKKYLLKKLNMESTETRAVSHTIKWQINYTV